MAIGREVLVQEVGDTHVLEVRDDCRYVVYSFVGGGNVCTHATSVAHFSFSRENSYEMSDLSQYFSEVTTEFIRLFVTF